MVEEKTGNPQRKLRIPDALQKPLAKDAKRQKKTEQAVILAILADHYGVEIEAPARGRPR